MFQNPFQFLSQEALAKSYFTSLRSYHHVQRLISIFILCILYSFSYTLFYFSLYSNLCLQKSKQCYFIDLPTSITTIPAFLYKNALEIVQQNYYFKRTLLLLLQHSVKNTQNRGLARALHNKQGQIKLNNYSIVIIMSSQGFPKVGQYIDVKDNDQLWQVGLVMDRNQHKATIRIEGFSKENYKTVPIGDESSGFKNQRIQPFRSMTRGYTGQRATQASRQHWKFQKQGHQQRLTRVKEFIDRPHKHSPQQIVQFLRGEHYFYIQSLLQNKYAEMEDLTKVYQYFFKHIGLVNSFISNILDKDLRSTFLNINKVAAQEDQWEKAYHNCFYQLFQGLSIISGLDARFKSFTVDNQVLIEEIKGSFPSHSQYIFHHIQQSKLFEKIQQLIERIYMHQILNEQLYQFKPSLAFLFSLSQLFQIVQQILATQKAIKAVQSIYQMHFKIVKREFQYLTVQKIAQHQTERQIQFVLKMLKPNSKEDLLDFTPWKTQIMVKMAIFNIQCDRLEKKLKGLAKLKELASEAGNPQQLELQQRHQRLSQNLQESKCLEALFVRNENVQMFKKSTQLVTFLYFNRLISIDDLLFVWSSGINKHPAIIKILFQYMIQMGKETLHEDKVLFRRFVLKIGNEAKLKTSQFYYFYFSLISTLVSENQNQYQLQPRSIINQISRSEPSIYHPFSYLDQLFAQQKHQQQQPADYQQYQQAGQQSQQQAQGQSQQSQQSQQQQSQQSQQQQQSQQSQQLQSQQSQEQQQSQQINSQNTQNAIKPQRALQAVQPLQLNAITLVNSLLLKKGFQMLLQLKSEAKYQLLIGIFSNAVQSSANAQEIIKLLYQNLQKKEYFSLCLHILKIIHVIQHRQNFVPQDFQVRFNSILKKFDLTQVDVENLLDAVQEIYVSNSQFLFKESQFLQLWVYFQSSGKAYRDSFLKWILNLTAKDNQINDTSQSKKINQCLNHNLMKFILCQIFNNQEYVNYAFLGKHEVSIILQLLIEVNLYEQKMEMRRLQDLKIHFNKVKVVELQGENILWKIFEKNKSQEVVVYLCQYITKFYFCFAPTLSPSLRRSRVDFIMEKIITNIKELTQSNNIKMLKPYLLLLKSNFQYVSEYWRIGQPFKPLSPTNISIKYTFQNQLYEQEAFNHQQIADFKKRIAQTHNFDHHSYKIVCKEGYFLQEYDYIWKIIPVSVLANRCVDFVKLQEGQQSIFEFMTSYIDLQTQNLLIDLLQNQLVAQQAYFLLGQYKLKIDKIEALARISTILQQYKEFNDDTFLAEIYYHVLEIKFYLYLMDKNINLTKICSKQALDSILRCMMYPIRHPIQIKFLKKIGLSMKKLSKKVQISGMKKLFIPQYLFSAIVHITNCHLKEKFLLEREHSKELAQIMYTYNNLITNLVKIQKMMIFYAQQPSFSEFMHTIYLNNELQQMRDVVTDKIKSYLTFYERQASFEQEIQKSLLHLFVDQIYYKLKEKQMLNTPNELDFQVFNLFSQVLSSLIKTVPSRRLQQTQIFQFFQGKSTSLYTSCLQYIQNAKLTQPSQVHWQSLHSHFNILLGIYGKKPDLIQAQIINFVLEHCLGLSKKTYISPICKNSQQILQAFQFLQQLLTTNKDITNVKSTIQTLKSGHHIVSWRSSNEWSMNVVHMQKKKYKGLSNPGCICYMNSLLQQLFTIKQFRNAILDLETAPNKMEVQQCKENDKQDQQQVANQLSFDVGMLKGLKRLFLRKRYSEQIHNSPTKFAKTIKSNDNQQLVILNQQMDIDQFKGTLFTKIQKGFLQLGYQDIIKKLFGGVYAHEIISKQCGHKSQRQQQFVSITLQVKDHILKSLQSLVSVQFLDGENKYHCSTCDKKVKAQKIQKIKHFPPYLIVCLKRFEFNYETGTKKKINHFCEFPTDLNLMPFSQQQINKKVTQMHKQEETLNGIPSESYEYSLKGVVLHAGSADSGHYISVVNENGEWIQFDDQKVSTIDFQKLKEKSFGTRLEKKEYTSFNAYLLIYQRKNAIQMPSQASAQAFRPEDKKIIDQIQNMNSIQRVKEMVFSQHYFQLVMKLNTLVGQLSDNYADLQFWYHFYLSYYFQIVARKDNHIEFLSLSQKIYREIQFNPIFCQLFLKAYTSPLFIKEYFLVNPQRVKLKVFGQMLGWALKQIYNHAKDQFQSKKGLVNKIFQCCQAVFIFASPVAEISEAFSQFIEYLVAQYDRKYAQQILKHFNLDKILFNSILNIGQDQMIKQAMGNYCNDQAHNVPFLSSIHLTEIPRPLDYAQFWKHISILLKLNNQFLKCQQIMDHPDKDFFIDDLNYFKNCLSEREHLVTVHMSELLTYRQVYYFYLSLEELGLNYELLQLFENTLANSIEVNHRQYFIYFEIVINSPETPIYHIKMILDLLEKIYNQGQDYWQILAIIQWVLRFASMSQQFCELLSDKTDFITLIIEKMNSPKFPIVPSLSKQNDRQKRERLRNRMLGIITTSLGGQLTALNLNIKTAYSNILDKVFKPTVKFFPPIDHYAIGEEIEYFDFGLKVWRTGKIIDKKCGVLTVMLQNNQSNLVNCFCSQENLRPCLSTDDSQEQQSFHFSLIETHAQPAPYDNRDRWGSHQQIIYQTQSEYEEYQESMGYD